MKRYFTVIICFLYTLTCLGQQPVFSGVVLDDENEPLAGGRVALLTARDTASFKVYYKFKNKFTALSGFNGEFAFSPDPNEQQEYTFIGVQALNHRTLIKALDTSYLILKMTYIGPPLGDLIIVTPEKPAIYLYPTQQTKVSVKHSFKGTVGTTYPAYGNGWEVIADTNGSLLNTKDNRRYEYLFWDGKCRFPPAHFDFKDGFVIKKEESQAFLWKTLAAIGLNNKEINDFVVYWLPQLEQHEQNFIHFRVNDDIDHSSILTVVPQPDSWIRLFMEFKPVDPGFHIAPQPLPACARKGFTLVEWGGAKLEEELSIQ